MAEWNIELDRQEGSVCSKMPEEPMVSVRVEAFGKILAMMNVVEDNLEWLGYCMGRKIGKGKYVVEDIFIPEQEVSSASCKNTNHTPEGTIGTVHSHHNMGAFHSGTDDKTAHQNQVNLVVDNDYNMESKVQVQLPCGTVAIVKADTKLVSSEGEWAKEQKDEKISKEHTFSKIGVYSKFGYPYGKYSRYVAKKAKRIGKAKKTKSAKKEDEGCEEEETFSDLLDRADELIDEISEVESSEEREELLDEYYALYDMIATRYGISHSHAELDELIES